MFIEIFILLIIYSGLVFVAAINPTKVWLSDFQLKQAAKTENPEMLKNLERIKYYQDFVSWKNILLSLFLVLFVILAIHFLGIFWGTILATVGAIEFLALSNLKLVRQTAEKVYLQIEPKLLQFAKQYAGYLKFLRGAALVQKNIDLQPDSRAEMVNIIKQSSGFINPAEKETLTRILSLPDKKIKDVMTPRSVIDFVDQDELLGPLKINDLYKTGHSRFPVVNQNIDHVVGILYLKDLVALTDKKSKQAKYLMKTPVYFVDQDEKIDKTFIAFLKHQVHLFVVINEYRETIGVVSIEDVVEEMLGRKIVDEDDVAEDLRKLALKKAVKNNNPKSKKDI